MFYYDLFSYLPLLFNKRVWTKKWIVEKINDAADLDQFGQKPIKKGKTHSYLRLYQNELTH